MNDARSASQRLAELLRREHHAMADFLIALADFDRHRRWEALGHTSCFYYLHRELGLSKSAAFYRASAADLIRRHPEIIEPLRDGRLCLSSIAELAKVMTAENRPDIVARFFHASAREAKAITAELRPVQAPPVRAVVTRAASSTPPELSAAPLDAPIDLAQLVRTSEPRPTTHARAASMPEPPPASTPPPPARKPDEVEPLTAELRRFHVTVSKHFLGKLSAARDVLSHRHPDATIEQVLDAALDLLLAKADKARGLVAKPRTAPPRVSDRPRHIPAAVKRAVWLRDGGRCQWAMAGGGGICASTRRLQLDHVVPVARGGASNVENVRLLCAAHNLAAAREHFGGDWMNRFAPGDRVRGAAAGTDAPPATALPPA